VAKDWDFVGNDGLISATDESNIEGKLHRIGLMIPVDDNANAFGKIAEIFFDGNKIGPSIFELRNRLVSIGGLMDWEVNAVVEMVRKASRGESGIQIGSSEVGESSMGEGGEVRVSKESSSRVPSAFAVSSTMYDPSEYQTDLDSSYGIDYGDSYPNEDMDFCAVIYSPNNQILSEDVKEALEYLEEYRSAALVVNAMNKWRTIANEGLRSAWDKSLESLQMDTYARNHISMARVARDVIGDVDLYRKIIDDLIEISPKWSSGKYILAVSEVATELWFEHLISKTDVLSYIEKASESVSLDDASDLEELLNLVFDRHSGLHIGDMDLAKRMLTKTLDKIPVKKSASSFKKKIEKNIGISFGI
jgi:hypothetical protein